MITSRSHIRRTKSAYTKPFIVGLTSIFALLGGNHAWALPSITETVEQLVKNVDDACPTIWEDLGEKINNTTTSSLWDQGNPSDSASYLAYHANKSPANASLTATQKDTALSNNAVIVADCTAARTKLLSKFYSNLPQDVVAAMADLEYEPGERVDGFEIGDIRHTGRTIAADGWIFLHGTQTVGGDNSSGATYEGDEYKALFDLARHWDQNKGAANDWGNGDKLLLPDLNGTVVSGGSSGNIGSKFGQIAIGLNKNQLPTHKHTTNNAGAHNHAVGNDSHSHKMRTSAYDGSAAAIAGWDYFGNSRPRQTYNFTHAANKTILSDTHKHTLTGAPVHKHTVNNEGLGESFSLAQPTMRFRVEMKYK